MFLFAQFQSYVWMYTRMRDCKLSSTQSRQPNLIKLTTKAYLEFKFLFSTSNVLSYLLGLYPKVLDVIDHIFESKCRKKKGSDTFFNLSASQRDGRGLQIWTFPSILMKVKTYLAKANDHALLKHKGKMIPLNTYVWRVFTFLLCIRCFK